MVKILNKEIKAVRGIGHNDLDGQVSVKLSEYYLGKQIQLPVLSLKHVSNADVDSTIIEELALLEKDTLLVITDVSPSSEVGKAIEAKFKEGYSIILFDHHKTALELNQYEWATVVVEKDGKKMCGTNLYFEFLLSEVPVSDLTSEALNYINVLSSLVELVRLYDTWEWYNLPVKTLEAKGLNDWFYMLGGREFDNWTKIQLQHGVSNLKGVFELGEEAEKELEKENIRISKYFNRKDKKLQIREYEGTSFGLVAVEQYHSEIGNMLAEAHPELMFIAMIDVDNDKVSLRTIHQFDVSKIAIRYGGGGHSAAAGFNLTEDNIEIFTPHRLPIQLKQVALV